MDKSYVFSYCINQTIARFLILGLQVTDRDCRQWLEEQMVTVSWRRMVLWMTVRNCWWSLAEVSSGVGLFSFLAEEVGVGSGCSCLSESAGGGSSTGSLQTLEAGGGGLGCSCLLVSASGGLRLTLLLSQRESGLQCVHKTQQTQ